MNKCPHCGSPQRRFDREYFLCGTKLFGGEFFRTEICLTRQCRDLATDRQILLDLATELAAGVDHSDCPTCRQLGECWYTLAMAKLDQMRGENK